MFIYVSSSLQKSKQLIAVVKINGNQFVGFIFRCKGSAKNRHEKKSATLLRIRQIFYPN